jgi:hypothetical protein
MSKHSLSEKTGSGVINQATPNLLSFGTLKNTGQRKNPGRIRLERHSVYFVGYVRGGPNHEYFPRGGRLQFRWADLLTGVGSRRGRCLWLGGLAEFGLRTRSWAVHQRPYTRPAAGPLAMRDCVIEAETFVEARFQRAGSNRHVENVPPHCVSAF